MLLFCCVFFFCVQNKAHAEAFFTLTSSNTNYFENNLQLELFFSLPRIDEMEKQLIEGTSINVDCIATLYSEVPVLPDSEIQSYIHGWQLRYEALTREFILYDENAVPIRSRNFEELFKNMFSRIVVEFYSLPSLESTSEYYVQFDIGMRHSTVPPWLETTLFFWEWNITSDSYTLDIEIQ